MEFGIFSVFIAFFLTAVIVLQVNAKEGGNDTASKTDDTTTSAGNSTAKGGGNDTTSASGNDTSKAAGNDTSKASGNSSDFSADYDYADYGKIKFFKLYKTIFANKKRLIGRKIHKLQAKDY
jgi:hypothetical protein